jgi:hypothetical protein
LLLVEGLVDHTSAAAVAVVAFSLERLLALKPRILLLLEQVQILLARQPRL